MNNFGNTIRQLREARGITQSQLSDRMTVSRSTIANWETGTRLPDLHMLSRLAECLGVNPTDLMEYLQDSQEVPAVIIVEDMPLILSSSRRILSSAIPEAEIYGFGNAAAALDFARSHHISIAFLDIELAQQSAECDLSYFPYRIHEGCTGRSLQRIYFKTADTGEDQP